MMLRAFRAIFRLPPGASSFAGPVDALHLFVLATTLLGALVLTLLGLYYVVRYRARAVHDTTERVTVSGPREALLIAFILGLFLLWWVLGYRTYLSMRQRPTGATPVYVVAKQWTWKFSYEDGRLSNDELVVPVGHPLELIMTSRDVIHSFFVPAMRVKQDVLPGRYVTLWFQPTQVGTFPIYCAEYCGVSHSNMLGEVHVLGEAEYRRWRQDGTRAKPLSALGREAAVRHACLSCHTVDGQPHIGPTWSRLYGASVALEGGEHVLADPGYLTESIMDPAARVVAGYRAVMPTYQGSLDSSETAAIVDYIRSLQDGPIAPSVTLPRVEPATESAGAAGSAGAAP